MMPGPMTMMACPPPLDRLESRFVAALGEVTGWRRVDGQLHLLSGERVVLRLTSK
jgi:heat shock protein HslJ